MTIISKPTAAGKNTRKRTNTDINILVLQKVGPQELLGCLEKNRGTFDSPPSFQSRWGTPISLEAFLKCSAMHRTPVLCRRKLESIMLPWRWPGTKAMDKTCSKGRRHYFISLKGVIEIMSRISGCSKMNLGFHTRGGECSTPEARTVALGGVTACFRELCKTWGGRTEPRNDKRGFQRWRPSCSLYSSHPWCTYDTCIKDSYKEHQKTMGRL